jgi:hypothetical protein
MTGRCTATSKQRGERCLRQAIPGGTVCYWHGGAAPQAKKAAEARLAELQNPAITRLGELIQQREFPSTALSAVKDVLDRTLGRPTDKVDLNVTSDMEIISRLQSARTRLARLRET